MNRTDPVRRRTRDAERLSLWDRGALAFAGALVGALSLGGYIAASLFVFPRAALALTWAAFATPAGIVFVACCALAGALCSPERLAAFFSVLWGTHSFWDSPRVQHVGIAIILLGGAALFYQRFVLH